MSTRCCAFAHCTNNATKISKWKRQFCEEHNCNFGTGRFICEQPFHLFPFPSKTKNIEARLK